MTSLDLHKNVGDTVQKTHHQKRTVRFNDEVSIRELPRQPLTKEDRKRIWYRPRDFEKFQKKDKLLATAYRKSSKLGSMEAFHLRGVEHLLSLRANIETRERLVASIQAVLKEQNRQRSLGINNPENMRKAAVKVTMRSKLIAFSLAKSDARAISTNKKRRSPEAKRIGDSSNKKRRSSGTKRANDSKRLEKKLSNEFDLTPMMTGLAINRATRTICLGTF